VNKVTKKSLLLVFVFLVSILSCALAAEAVPDFYLNATVVKQNILINQSAEFIITITNNREFDSKFTLRSLELVHWDILARPVYDFPSVEVPANSSKNITLFLKPISSSLGTGAKRITFEVVSDKKVKQNMSITVFIKPDDPRFGKYYPRIEIEGMEIPATIDPRQELVLFFNPVNKNSLDLTTVILRVESRLIEKTETEFALGPYDEYLVRVVPKLNQYAYAGKDVVTISIIVDGEVVKEYERAADISTVDLPYDVKENMTSSFLRSVFKYTVANPSNINKTEPFYLKTSYIDRIFSWTNPKAKISKEQGHNYKWDMAIVPGGSTTVIVTRSYRSLLYLVIALILFLLFYYAFKPDIIISKSASHLVRNQFGVSEATIQLNVKNTSNYRLEKVVLTESLPTIIEYVPENQVGVLSPMSAKKHEFRGSTLFWHFEELAPKEERVLKFKVRVKIDIVGNFKMPETTAEFFKRGKHKIVFSNPVFLAK
jgi:hypothetical protein